ncbi:MAG: Rieske 2Fe-2S domain-containing protein [Proteobacteria bacterium]|nr:Rieske 2Fe-2S domain-containing protein [Pseudomonadota bacterium]
MSIPEHITFPEENYSAVPYGIFNDPDIFEREQARIFRGPIWGHVGLDVEIPNPGDFKTSFLGATPIVLTRNENGEVRGFVNSCAHRGTTLVREARGNLSSFTCVYHRWNYNLDGDLIGVPFRRGLHGVQGLPDEFKLEENGLRMLRLESYAGLLFATLSPDTEPLREFLDEPMCAFLDRVFSRPIEVLGYSRQRIDANWKLYLENLRDPYHAGLLHQFSTIYGLFRNTENGATILDKKQRHEIHFSLHGSDSSEDTESGYGEVDFFDRSSGSLKYGDIFKFLDEPGRGGKASDLMTLFPSAVFQQLANSLATRQIRPRSANDYELYWTYFGYADDSPEIRQKRLEQANLVGPAGFSSMEDGEIGALVQRGIRFERDGHSTIAMGGWGPIEAQETTLTEVPVRGFWRHYCELMDIPITKLTEQ